MKGKFSLFFIGMLIILFVFSTYKILNRRVKKGDVYTQQYSSLRYDPMGTSIFFNSLQKMGFQVERLKEDHMPNNLDPQHTIMFILSPFFSFNKDLEDAMIGFILDGGRIVLTDDKYNSLMTFFDTRIESIHKDPNGKEKKESSEAVSHDIFDFSGEKIKVIHQRGLLSDWKKRQTVYKCDERDVVLLLNHGKGDIVISSETYFISNESMAKAPPTTFLTWLMDGRKHVIVDEYHHGITIHKGISFLLYKYHLYWFIAYLALIFILYLWRVLPRFQAPLHRPSENNLRSYSSLQGYTYLLTQSVPKNRLLDICMTQWLKSPKNKFFKEKNETEIKKIEKAVRMESVGKDEELVRHYNDISHMIKEQSKLI